jgi:hypothetical protein
MKIFERYLIFSMTFYLCIYRHTPWCENQLRTEVSLSGSKPVYFKAHDSSNIRVEKITKLGNRPINKTREYINVESTNILQNQITVYVYHRHPSYVLLIFRLLNIRETSGGVITLFPRQALTLRSTNEQKEVATIWH